MGASQAHGIEVGQGVANLARMRFRGTPFEQKAKIVTFDGTFLPYADACFDIIFSIHVIEHTRNPELYLTELLRVLRPNSVIFLDLPNRYYWREQHTFVLFIHFPPTRKRDSIISFLLAKPLRYLWSDQTVYKLQTLRGYQLPSASELDHIYNLHKESYGLELTDALFFGSAPQRTSYRALTWKHWLGLVRKMNTFRMFISKSECLRS
jgi:SAM-dependent methyltransferase